MHKAVLDFELGEGSSEFPIYSKILQYILHIHWEPKILTSPNGTYYKNMCLQLIAIHGAVVCCDSWHMHL